MAVATTTMGFMRVRSCASRDTCSGRHEAGGERLGWDRVEKALAHDLVRHLAECRQRVDELLVPPENVVLEDPLAEQGDALRRVEAERLAEGLEDLRVGLD